MVDRRVNRCSCFLNIDYSGLLFVCLFVCLICFLEVVNGSFLKKKTLV